MSSAPEPVRVLGIGSPAGDDQAGWLAVDALLAEGGAAGVSAVITKLDRPGANLIPLLENASWVILIDAMQSGGLLGQIRHFSHVDWPAYGHGLSSHGLGVVEALSLAQALGSLPPRLDLYGIEIGVTNPGMDPAPVVRAAARELATAIAARLIHEAPA
jgi:hydrogenase maturation protease